MWLATGSLLPQFGRLSHVISLRLSSGHSGLVLILSTDYAACPPCPSPARWWQTQASELPLQLAVAVSMYSVGFCFFFLPLMLPSEISKLPTHPPVRGFPTVWKVLLHDPLPGWVSVPNSFVSLFVFYILSYLLSKRMCCLSGCPVSSANLQKLFCGSCSAFK